MESAARTALNQLRALVARRGRAAATAVTFPVFARARHMSATTTGTKRPPSLVGRAAAEFRKGDPPAKPRLYIVHLLPTEAELNNADIDESEAAERHHSKLSSLLGSEEEATRCMVRSFYPHAFSAMLTDSQALDISDLPGVVGVEPNTEFPIDDPLVDVEVEDEEIVDRERDGFFMDDLPTVEDEDEEIMDRERA